MPEIFTQRSACGAFVTQCTHNVALDQAFLQENALMRGGTGLLVSTCVFIYLFLSIRQREGARRRGQLALGWLLVRFVGAKGVPMKRSEALLSCH